MNENENLNPISREAARDMIAILTSSLNNREDEETHLSEAYFHDVSAILKGKNVLEIIALITQMSGLTIELMRAHSERTGVSPEEFLQSCAIDLG